MQKDIDHHNITELIYSAKPEIRDRGHLYYKTGLVKEAQMDFRTRSASFKVLGSQKQYYNVVVKDITSPAISVSCDCPYDKGICKHSVAALYYLRDNFQNLLDDYNKRFYPEIPEQTIRMRTIEDFMKVMKDSELEEVQFGKLLHKYKHTSLNWFNPVLKILSVNVDEYVVKFHNYDRHIPMVVECTCGQRNCKHMYAACFYALDFKKSNKAKEILKYYERGKNKAIPIGRIENLRKFYTKEVLPEYLPENYEIKELSHNYIKLRLKVRYQFVEVSFKNNKGTIYSKCSCDDNVKGLCKHQIAALNLLLDMEDRFFQYLANKEHINDLRAMFK